MRCRRVVRDARCPVRAHLASRAFARSFWYATFADMPSVLDARTWALVLTLLPYVASADMAARNAVYVARGIAAIRRRKTA